MRRWIAVCQIKGNCLSGFGEDFRFYGMLQKEIRLCCRSTQAILKRIGGEKDEGGQKTGSRYSDGNVPNVNWNDDNLNVNWHNPGNANDNLHSREEVSERKFR